MDRDYSQSQMVISILSLYTEGDDYMQNYDHDRYISILSLYTEGDTMFFIDRI